MERLPISYLVTWVGAIALAFVPLFLEGNDRHYSLILIGAILAVLLPMIVDQYNGVARSEKLQKELMEETQKSYETR